MFRNLFNNSKYSNVLTIILIIAIIGIIIIIGIIGYRIYKKHAIQKGAEEAVAQFEDLVNKNQDSNNNTVSNVNADMNGIVDDSQITTSKKTGKTTYKGFNVVATIQIPKINVKYPILEKVTKRSLETSVALLYGPGLNQVGNNVIIGHNYRNGTMFSNVKKLTNGDKIYITDTSGKKIKYTVYKIYRTSGDDATYMTRNTNGKREISLSTCTDDSKARTIVWAKES